MERAGIIREYQDIIEATSKGRLPEIDVLEPVMERITNFENYRRPFLKKSMRRTTTMMASVLTLILMISVTAYAASEYIQIRNKTGTVRVQWVAPTEKNPALATYYNKYAMQAQEYAKSGELIAYYVKDNKVSSESEPGLEFVYKENRIPSYIDFAAEIKRTGAPELPEVINGYTFEYGTINPYYPLTGETIYQKTLKELTDQASKTASGENRFMMKIPWSKPGAVVGEYSRGGAKVSISAILLYGGDMFVEQEQENKVEKITVAGTEVVYNNVDKEYVSYHYLNWYNEKQDAYYTLTSHGDKRLTKEQFLQIAKELIE